MQLLEQVNLFVYFFCKNTFGFDAPFWCLKCRLNYVLILCFFLSLNFFYIPVVILQPMSMVLPGVVGFKLLGKLKDGVTATDLVLTVTQMLRKHGVVGKFVEFYGKLTDRVKSCYPESFGSFHCLLLCSFLCLMSPCTSIYRGRRG